MEKAIYLLRNRSMPWGDYGDILLSGMTGNLDRQSGLLQLERTGPFVPPISITGIDAQGHSHLVVTDAFKDRLEITDFSGMRFLPVIKRRIVRLDWQNWDLTADDPAEYPDSFEPEDYILARPHDPALAEQIGTLWELCLEEHARTERRHVGQGHGDEHIWIVRASWDGTDCFRASGVGYVYLSEDSARWLEHTASGWVTTESARVR